MNTTLLKEYTTEASDGYLGAIKMIYIDPPYNTGHDFVYPDSFIMDNEEYNEGKKYRAQHVWQVFSVNDDKKKSYVCEKCIENKKKKYIWLYRCVVVEGTLLVK